MATGFAEGLCSIFKPKRRLTGSEWADKYRHIAPGTSSEAGPWRTSRTPYLKEILDVCTDRETRHIALMMSSQVGKTEVVLNIAGYYMEHAPAPILLVQPTEGAAQRFSKKRLDGMLKASPALRGLAKDEETILQKSFPGGSIRLTGAETEAGLSSDPIQILLMDEVDRYNRKIKGGDPRKLAIQRTANYVRNKKIIEVSTPGKAEDSRIYNDAWLLSDQRRYHIPCKACGNMQHLEWEHVEWDKDDNNNVIIESIRYECKECKHHMRGAYQLPGDFFEGAQWIAENPGAEIAGFHLNTLYSPWFELYEMVNEYVKAKRDKDHDGQEEFDNLKLGLPHIDTREKADYETLHKNHRHRYGDYLPSKVLMLSAGVDTQDDYLAVEVLGWGEGKESWGIRYRIIPGDTSQPAVWNELDEYLQRTWQTEDGRSLPVTMSLVDSGGHRGDEVHKWCKDRAARGIYSIYGATKIDAPIIPSKPTKNRFGGNSWALGVGLLKARTLQNAAVTDEGPKYCHWPIEGEAGYDEQYFKGLLSERYEFKYSNGKYVRQWKKVYERNEPLDCRNYATAAMELSGIDLDMLAERVKAMAEGKPIEKSAPAKKRRRVASRGLEK